MILFWKPKLQNKIYTQSRSFVSQVLRVFLNTWTLFLVFLAVFLLLHMGVPSHLDLNVAWLSFLNGLLIAVCPALPWQQFFPIASVVGDLILAWSQRTNHDCTKHFNAGPSLEKYFNKIMRSNGEVISVGLKLWSQYLSWMNYYIHDPQNIMFGLVTDFFFNFIFYWAPIWTIVGAVQQ